MRATSRWSWPRASTTRPATRSSALTTRRRSRSWPSSATAISRMELGRLDDETTANVGVITGGTASNVVAGHCRVDGEARSLDDEKASEAIGAMVDACTWAASEHQCD